MSSCFFSSREKMRISARSVFMKCLSTVLPNEPVPPVIINVRPSKADLMFSMLGSLQGFKRLSQSFEERFT